jgi:hypothetical protein
MQGTSTKGLQLFAVAFIAMLAWPQLAGAQRLTPIPPRGPARHQAQAQSLAKAGVTAQANASEKSTSASPWTPLTNQPTFLDPINCAAAANPILLTDGTVLVQDGGCQDWWKLTPDKHGSYVNGTWTQIASLPAGYSPLYHSSAVLPDGRMIIEGGEYNFFVPVWTPLGAIYDPLANTWTPVNAPDGWTTVGDSQSVVLPDGTFMQSNCCTNQAALLNPKTLTWTPTGAGKFDPNDEEGWTLLPNGKVLTVDAYVPISPFPYIPDGTNYEIYNPKTGNWNVAGTTPVQLWDSWLTCGELSQEPKNGPTFEVGPAVLRPDGTVFYMGSDTCPDSTTASGFASGHTAIYNSHTGKWKAGPDIPGGNNIADGPAALEPNGKVLMFASPAFGAAPAAFFEWDGQDISAVPGTPNTPTDGSFFGNMLVLPTGQILFTDFSDDIEIYTPRPRHRDNLEPVVLFTPIFLDRGHSYPIFGFRFNGSSQGAAYGDDVQAATNFPLVRITNLISGHVQYSRTHDHSSMAVAFDDLVSTHFDVPAVQEPGISKLEVVANGVASDPVFVFVTR